MRLVLVVGTTATARIDGISAAGATPALSVYTPAADAEILTFGRPVWAPVVPVSPHGCPTPAMVTRAIRELLGFEVLVVDTGLATRTAAPTVVVGRTPGRDVRAPVAVPDATEIFDAARDLGRSVPDRELVVGESVPGGTTTAMGVLRALGEPYHVSSSRRENPTERKAEVISTGLSASGLDPGELAGEPVRAIEAVGDPVMAAVAGVAMGRLDADRQVTLAGGTQMVAVAAVLRHANVEAPLEVATTSYVAADESADLSSAAAALDLDVTVTDPGFAASDYDGLRRYGAGEAKEGAGMGGALQRADATALSMAAVRRRVIRCLDRVAGERP